MIEAKQVFVEKPEAFGRCVDEAFSMSAAQLLSLAKDLEADTELLSLVFVVPVMGVSDEDGVRDAFVRAAEQYLRDLKAPALWAWSFPVVARDLRGLWRPESIYPGVMAFVKALSRAS